jgi:hypothetical protein
MGYNLHFHTAGMAVVRNTTCTVHMSTLLAKEGDTPCTSILLAVEKGYTLHVYTANCGNGYTLHITAGSGTEYILHIQTAGCWR